MKRVWEAIDEIKVEKKEGTTIASKSKEGGEVRGQSRGEPHCVLANLYGEVKCCSLLPTRFSLRFS